MPFSFGFGKGQLFSKGNVAAPQLSIITENLKLHIDAANPSSYPGSGTAITDLSGNGLHCSLINGPTYSNGAFVLDGTNDHIATNSNVDIRGGFTLELWMSSSLTSAGWLNMFGHGTLESNQGLHVRIYPDAVGGYAFNMYFNDANASSVGATFPQNVFYHIVATYSGSTYAKKLYVNGVNIPLTGTQNAYTNTGTTPLRFGAIMGTGMFSGWTHPGKIAQARYYSAVLTDAQVLNNYDATKNTFA